MIRTTICAVVLFLTLLSNPHAQVDIADKGDDGFGIGLAGAFSSGTSGLGGNVSGTIKGMVDFGFLLSRVSSGNRSALVKGIQVTFLPLRTNQPAVRWSLGGLFSFESGSISSSRPSYSSYGDYSSSRSLDATTIGGLMTIDIALSPQADFQLAGSIANVNRSSSTKNLNIVTVGLAIVSKQPKRNFFIGGSVSIPSDETYTTFGVQLGYFFKREQNRGRM